MNTYTKKIEKALDLTDTSASVTDGFDTISWHITEQEVIA